MIPNVIYQSAIKFWKKKQQGVTMKAGCSNHEFCTRFWIVLCFVLFLLSILLVCCCSCCFALLAFLVNCLALPFRVKESLKQEAKTIFKGRTRNCLSLFSEER